LLDYKGKSKQRNSYRMEGMLGQNILEDRWENFAVRTGDF
jgi:hypothetical protein